jgi:hypothetical protein
MKSLPSNKSRTSRAAAVDAPYALYAARVEATAKQLTIALTNGVTVIVPILSLGKPWTSATPQRVGDVRLRMGGSWLWWDALNEGLVLDELLPTALGLNPAAMLARQARGRRASPAKAAAARANGAKGGRPRKRRAVSSR